MPWLQIRKPNYRFGLLIELSGSRIECDWGKFHILLFQATPNTWLTTIRFNSQDQMQAFLKNFISRLQNNEPFIDTGELDMDFKDVV